VAHRSDLQSKNLSSISDSIENIIRNFRIQLVGNRLDNEIDNIIDYAGRQRMLCQKISKELLFAICGINRQENLNQLTRTCGLFNQVIEGLISGDAELNLIPTKHQAINDKLLIIRDLWHDFSCELDLLIHQSSPGRERLENIYIKNMVILREMDAAVAMYEELAKRINRRSQHSDKSDLINLAGKQRMLIQKMAKEVLFAQLDVHRSDCINNLQSSVAAFQHGLSNLQDCMEKVDENDGSNKQLMGKFDQIHTSWGQFKNLINILLSGKSLKEMELISLSQLNMEILKLSNEAVMLIKLME